MDSDDSSSGEDVKPSTPARPPTNIQLRTPYSLSEYRRALDLLLEHHPQNPSGKVFAKALNEAFPYRRKSGLQSFISTKLRKELQAGPLYESLKYKTSDDRLFIRDYMKDVKNFKLPPREKSSVVQPRAAAAGSSSPPAGGEVVAKEDNFGAAAEGPSSPPAGGKVVTDFKIHDFGNSIHKGKFPKKSHGVRKVIYKRLEEFKVPEVAASSSSKPKEENMVPSKETKILSPPSVDSTMLFQPTCTSSPNADPGTNMVTLSRADLQSILTEIVEKRFKEGHHTPKANFLEATLVNNTKEPCEKKEEKITMNESSLSDGTLAQVASEAEFREGLSNNSSDPGLSKQDGVISVNNFDDDDEDMRYEARLSTVTVCEVFVKSRGKPDANFWAVPSKRGYELTSKSASNWSTVVTPGAQPSVLNQKEAFQEDVAKRDILTMTSQVGQDLECVSIKNPKVPNKIVLEVGELTVAPGVKGKVLVMVRKA